MKKMKTAIIGFGMAGQLFHYPPLKDHPFYEVTHIMTQNEKRIQMIQKLNPSIEIVSHFDDIINNPSIDLIIIATANDVHYEYTKKALEHKKHVICEKPFVEKTEQAIELFTLAKHNQLVLRVFHNRIHDGDMLTILELMQSNRLGNIKSFSARFDRFIPEMKDNWRYEKGVMAGIYYDLAPHLIFDAISLFGFPQSVYLDLFYHHQQVVDDHFEMTLYYPDKVCFLGASTLERHSRPRFEIIGELATFVKYGFDQPDVNYDPNQKGTNGLKGSLYLNSSIEEIPIKIGNHYRYYDQIAQLIHDKKTNHDVDKQLAVVHIMEQGILSYQEKRQVNLNLKEMNVND
jgi:scyllo-inositol 2-dehydrogenase (NADP+)